MIKLCIVGANGKMGKKVKENCANFNGISPVCGINKEENLTDKAFPIYDTFDKIKGKIDVIIDFSSPKVLENELDYCIKTKTPLVLCSTGLDEKDEEKVKLASKKIAIFRSANMSLGVNVLIELAKKAYSNLLGFDIEIIEKHHNQKKDAPSGTALMIANEIKKLDNDKTFTFGRNGLVGARDKNEIGIHSIRGGNIVGEHQVIFAGESETITLTHEATDRAVFAVGAIKASLFIMNKKNGLFDMSDMINGK